MKITKMTYSFDWQVQKKMFWFLCLFKKFNKTKTVALISLSLTDQDRPSPRLNQYVLHTVSFILDPLQVTLTVVMLYCLATERSFSPFTGLCECSIKKLNQWKSGTHPIQQEDATFIHVEMGFDAFWFCICVLLKAAAHSWQFDCGQVQRTKHTATHNQQGHRRRGFTFKYILTMWEYGSKQELGKDHTFNLPWKTLKWSELPLHKSSVKSGFFYTANTEI